MNNVKLRRAPVSESEHQCFGKHMKPTQSFTTRISPRFDRFPHTCIWMFAFPTTIKSENKYDNRSRQPMSLLSTYLSANTADKPVALSICRVPARHENKSHHTREYTEDPPESLSYSKTTQKLHGTKRLKIGKRTNSSFPPLDLAASPLTSCSYHTLTKEYNMDTWRMYERIQAARSRSEEESLFLVKQAVDRIKYDTSSGIEQQAESSINGGITPVQEAGGIFDLEL